MLILHVVTTLRLSKRQGRRQWRAAAVLAAAAAVLAAAAACTTQRPLIRRQCSCPTAVDQQPEHAQQPSMHRVTTSLMIT